MKQKMFYQLAVATFLFLQLTESPLVAQESNTKTDSAITYNQFVSDQWIAVNTTFGKLMANRKVSKVDNLEELRTNILTQIKESRTTLNKHNVFENNLNLHTAMLQLLGNFQQIAENEMVEITTLLEKENLGEKDVSRFEELTNQINMNKTLFEQAFIEVQAKYAKKYGLLFIGGSMVKNSSK